MSKLTYNPTKSIAYENKGYGEYLFITQNFKLTLRAAIKSKNRLNPPIYFTSAISIPNNGSTK